MNFCHLTKLICQKDGVKAPGEFERTAFWYIWWRCVWEKEENGALKDDSLNVHTNPDMFEKAFFSLNFQLNSVLSFQEWKDFKLFSKRQSGVDKFEYLKCIEPLSLLLHVGSLPL